VGVVLQLRGVEHHGLSTAEEVVHAPVYIAHREGDHRKREASCQFAPTQSGGGGVTVHQQG
jgi:hypothetical protein